MKWMLLLVMAAGSFISCRSGDKAVPPPTDTLAVADLADPQIRAITERIRADPENAENYFVRSRLYIQKQNFKPAFNDLSLAIALDSSNVVFYFAMADLALLTGSADAAIESYRKALKLEPENEEALLKLSKVYFFQKDYTNSLIQLSLLEDLDERNYEVWFVRGLNLKEMGDTSQAVAAFQKAVSLYPEFYDAFIQLGLLHSNKPSQLAAQYFDNAIRMDSSRAEAWYNKGKFFQDRGDRFFNKNEDAMAHENFEKAKSVYRNLVRINEQFEDAWFNMGFIYIRQDSLEQAKRMFDVAIEVNPSYAEAYYYRALIALEKGNREQALTDLRQAVSLDPSYERAREELARVE